MMLQIIIENEKKTIMSFAEDMCDVCIEAMKSSYSIDSSDKERKRWLKSLEESISNGDRYILCFDENKVRGYIDWFYKDKSVKVKDFMIHPICQRDGITARKLIKSFIGEITDIDFEYILAYTNYQNSRMQMLLEKAGFKVIEKRERGLQYSLKKGDFIKKFIPARRFES